MKECKTCKQIKDNQFFPEKRNVCKDCKRKRQKVLEDIKELIMI